MALHYKITIDNPSTHRVKVALKGTWPQEQEIIDFYLPVWAPGSYLIREYAKNVTYLQATTGLGEPLFCEKTSKNTWSLDRTKLELKQNCDEFELVYEVYCFEISVRTSFVNDDHAFLHLPDLLMNSDDLEVKDYRVELSFPPGWSKVHTGLEEVGEGKRVCYRADNYTDLIDSPIEIGCHDSTGFKAAGLDHHVIAFGKLPRDYSNLVQDMQTVTEAVIKFWGEAPYRHYYYMTHFIPGVYGGLEHHNSTVMQFDPFELETRSGYLNYLGLVSHEFFHTWNVKRIRPLELVDFDYNNENYTRMHWLTEGLTSFADDALLYSCGISTAQEYAAELLKAVNRLELNQGRKFQTLEESSFDTWIKLYRPNENSGNAMVSYYLKGDLVFFCLNAYLSTFGKTIQDLCHLLWQAYRAESYVGLSKEDVLSMISELSDDKTSERFDTMISTTEELPFEECCELVGLEVERKREEGAYLGLNFEVKENAVYVKSVVLDGPAYQYGLNARDELLAADGLRITRDNYQAWLKSLKKNQSVELTVSRLSYVKSVVVTTSACLDKVSALTVKDEKLFAAAHHFKV